MPVPSKITNLPARLSALVASGVLTFAPTGHCGEAGLLLSSQIEAAIAEGSDISALVIADSTVATDPDIFGFLDSAPLPEWDGPVKAGDKRWQAWEASDTGKARALTHLIDRGAGAQFADAKLAENLLVRAAGLGGERSVGVLVDHGVPAGARALDAALDSAWVFPGSVTLLLDAGARPNPAIDVIASGMARYGKALEGMADDPVATNVVAALGAVATATERVSAEALRMAITIPLPDLVAVMLEADQDHDPAECARWMVAARLGHPMFPKYAAEALKTAFAGLAERQQAVLDALPELEATFLGPGGAGGRALWRTDGTDAGTAIAYEPEAGGADLTVVGVTPNGTAIVEVRADGSKRGLVIPPDGGDPWELTVLAQQDEDESRAGVAITADGYLLFISGGQLWQSDGSEGGTEAVSPGRFAPTAVFGAGGHVYFRTGTSSADAILYEIRPGARRLIPWLRGATALAVEAESLFVAGNALFIASDHTASGDIAYVLESDSGFERPIFTGLAAEPGMFRWNGAVYFSGRESTPKAPYGWELYRTDGTGNGTKMVADLQPAEVGDPGDSHPHGFIALGDRLVFTASGSSGESGLYAVDAKSALAQRLGPVGGEAIRMGEAVVYAVAGTGGMELWQSDGTAEGTVLVEDGISAIEGLCAVGSSALFWNGAELWRTDGTRTGTQPVAAREVGGTAIYPRHP